MHNRASPDDIEKVHTQPTATCPPTLSFEQFRRFISQSGHKDSDASGQPGQSTMRATVLALPVSGTTTGQPFTAVVTAVSGAKIALEAQSRLDAGDRFCVRLETAEKQAAWVQCTTLAFRPTITGVCQIDAEFAKVSCSHACGCPAFIFIQHGQRVGCPYAGHSGCLQIGPAGPAIKSWLTL